MSTLKSSNENMVIDADGSGNDIIFKSNNVQVGSLDQAGLLTATTFAGSGASLTALNATNLGSGTVPTARLGSGTASSSVFLSGANTWISAADATKLPLAGGTMSGLITTFKATLADSATTGHSEMASFSRTTSGNMADTYGGAIQLKLGDTSQAEQGVCAIDWERNGADNSGKLFLYTRNAGTWNAGLTIDASASDVKVERGDLVFGTAGKGICLGVTTNTDANTLDDYEEGTWTATVSAGSISSQNCSYTKIGRSINLRGSVAYGGGSDSASLGGIPFTQGSKPVAGAVFAADMGVSSPGTMIMIKMNASNSTLYVYSFLENSITSAQQSTGELYFDITYEE